MDGRARRRFLWLAVGALALALILGIVVGSQV